MNTTTLLAKALAEKFENTHFEDEYAIIMEMFEVLQTELGFDYKTARFILNEEDFVPDTLDEFYSVTGLSA